VSLGVEEVGGVWICVCVGGGVGFVSERGVGENVTEDIGESDS
jgi:hypothetical protein